jgi:hypothetical protein
VVFDGKPVCVLQKSEKGCRSFSLYYGELRCGL